MKDDQSALLSAIYAGGSSAFDKDALAVYRGNLHAHAKNVFIISFPTLHKMIGDQIAELAVSYLKSYPHNGSDWGDWGDALSVFIASYPPLQDYPYLVDIAALDWALHQCERAGDQSFSSESLMQLGECDISKTTFSLAPGFKIIDSNYPIVSLYQAHQIDVKDDFDGAITAVKQKLADNTGEIAIIWRREFKGLVGIVLQVDASWLKLIDNGHSISEALDTIDESFDFSQWFTSACELGYIFALRQLK